MHEMGIILHMANMLDETAKEQNLTKIGSVTLEVGEVSGIMTDLFVDCWKRKLREDLRNCEIWQGMSVLSQWRDLAGGRQSVCDQGD